MRIFINNMEGKAPRDPRDLGYFFHVKNVHASGQKSGCPELDIDAVERGLVALRFEDNAEIDCLIEILETLKNPACESKRTEFRK